MKTVFDGIVLSRPEPEKTPAAPARHKARAHSIMLRDYNIPGFGAAEPTPLDVAFNELPDEAWLIP